jgi:zinc transporter, ZIP family
MVSPPSSPLSSLLDLTFSSLTAIAAGMMIAASYSLAIEGYESISSLPPNLSSSSLTSSLFLTPFLSLDNGSRVAIGFIFGIIFILLTKYFLSDSEEELNVCSLTGSDAQKVLMIMFVMTLHSISEGIGIGVSFGGSHGSSLGKFISISLALHNIPEGLAIALVLTSRGVPTLRTFLLCIFSSIPQPIMAIPAYYFVENFLPILPVGLGFASGAMLYVALFELIPEAIEDCKYLLTLCISILSFVVMFTLQEYAATATASPSSSFAIPQL